MADASTDTPNNGLLRKLTGPARQQLLAGCELRQLSLGPALAKARRVQAHVVFPVTCVLAAMASEVSTAPLALLLVGRQGMLGASLGLGVEESPYGASVLLPGSAWCIGRGDFLGQLQTSDSLRRTTRRLLFLQSRQVAVTAACAHFHHLEARLAFWLLMIDSEGPGGHFHATHQQFARLLGVQRAAVSIAASRLRDRGAIHYSRGDVHIDRRERLERAACRCYWECRNDAQRPLR